VRIHDGEFIGAFAEHVKMRAIWGCGEFDWRRIAHGCGGEDTGAEQQGE
jgi:hypothetical protein